jgi:hypothetical protein
VDDLTQFEEALNWTRHARDLLTRLPLTSGEVANDDGRVSSDGSDDAYALSDGDDYVLVYKDGNSGFDVDLPDGEFRARYYNPRTGDFAETESVSGGGTVGMDAPSFGDDMAVLFERQ